MRRKYIDKNTVAYAGQTLLTVYHKGFDEQIGDRKSKRTEKPGKYNLSFYEEVVSDISLLQG
mgnify:FL=1